MLRMETQPGRLVDPLWTPFEESGLQGTYYVNLATWDIQRHPGWYDLPRGGILYVLSQSLLEVLSQSQMRADGHRKDPHVSLAHRVNTPPDLQTAIHSKRTPSFEKRPAFHSRRPGWQYRHCLI